MTISDYLSSLFKSNPYFEAGLGLGCLGASAQILKRLAVFAQIYARRNFTMTLEVPNNDPCYNWLLQWLTVRNRSVSQHTSVITTFRRHISGKISCTYDFIPSTGSHYFRMGNRFVKVERTREKQMIGTAADRAPFESITLTTVGRDRIFFREMLHKAREAALQKEEGCTIVYKAFGVDWQPFGYPQSRRPVSSVVLDDGLSEKIVDDVKDFINNHKWYTDRGVPYRRGYLLYGPPGCGKSSFITALAGELQYSICILSLNDVGLCNNRLDLLLSKAPLESIILIEDVDAAFSDRLTTLQKAKPAAYEGMHGMSLSGFLNALDGVASSEGRILIMTTNYKDRLDTALIRPGRVDLQAYIGLSSKSQLRRMFLKFYPEQNDLADQFSELIGPNCVSPAQVQGHFLMHKNDPESAVKNVKSILSQNSGAS